MGGRQAAGCILSGNPESEIENSGLAVRSRYRGQMEINRREFIVVPAAAMAGSLLAADAEVPWQRRARRLGQTQYDRTRSGGLERGRVGGLLGQPESGRDAGERHRDTGFLSDESAVPPQGQVPGRPGFLRRLLRRRQEARAARDRAHEPGPELGRRGAGAPGVVPARRAGQRRAPHRRPQAVPDLHVLHLHDRLHAGDHGGDQLAVRRGRPVHQRLAAAGEPAGLPLRQCRKLPPPGTLAYWDKFNERTIYLWKLYDSIAKKKKPSNFYFANLGGGIRSTANLVQLGEICEWFQCDNQGRGGDDTPIWGCALQGRVCNAVQKGKMATNVTAAWSTGRPRWRNVYKSQQEERMWFNETLAAGMVPYHHIIGGENGMGEDRRWLEPAHQYFNWMARHDPHFVNKRSIANVGVVMGQRTHLFYQPPRGALMPQYMDGMYYALLEGRFLFDFVHEEKLAPEDLKKYSALLLPNTALLSDEQCRQLRAYVDGGGSLLATFETSLYTERNQRRADFGLADVFGIRKAGDIVGTNGNAYLARIEKQHAILEGFANTSWIPGAENRVPVAPVEGAVLTRGARLRGVPTGIVLSRAAADRRAGGGRAGKGKEPPGLLPGRHRADNVAVRPYRPGAALAEFHPLGGGRERRGAAGDD